MENRRWLTLLSNVIPSASYLSPPALSFVNSSFSPVCFLFDNGSLRAASTQNLRGVATVLAEELRVDVRAVSLLHSSAVDPASLDGKKAELLEPALQTWLTEQPTGAAIALPFFFGPSAALTEYVPERLAALRGKFPQANIRLARPLVDPAEKETEIADALADAVKETMTARSWTRPKVIVVDHGSPQPAVAAVRDHLGKQVAQRLGALVETVGVASMERRPGPEYAFSDPLLADRLRTPPFDRGNVVLAMQFLSPGRHAGPEGDVATIVRAAEAERPGLCIAMTDTLGTRPGVIRVLARRYRECLGQ
jgi:Uncharacterized conserved protein